MLWEGAEERRPTRITMADGRGGKKGRYRRAGILPHPAALRTAAIGMQKEPAIAALHHGDPQAHETSGPITQFMRDPIAFRNFLGAKQGCGNHTVGRAVEAPVQRAQSEDQSVAARL